MRSYLLAIFCLFLVIVGCKRNEAPSPPSAAVEDERIVTRKLLGEAVTLHRVELPGAALPVWRSVRSVRPKLLLLAADPELLPAPMQLREQITHLLESEPDAVIEQGSDPLRNTDPLLIPASTVDAALRGGFFSELIWIMPQRDEEQKLSADVFLEQMKRAGFLDPDDLVSPSRNQGEILSGTLRGVPFRVVTLDTLPRVAGPVVLHIDLDWFQQGYRSEISTPMLGQLTGALMLLREKRLQVAAATFCAGSLDRRISLDVRFAGDITQKILADPLILDAPPPENWKRLKDILYLQNFFKKEMINDLAEQMVIAEPNLPWVRFVAYRAAADMRDIEGALEHLEVAVKYDPVYAIEYRELMWKAYEAGDLPGAARMIDHALAALPGLHQVQIERARLASDMKDYAVATDILSGLKKKGWSTIYFPVIPEEIDGLYDARKHKDSDIKE